jgi:hypothetical protein
LSEIQPGSREAPGRHIDNRLLAGVRMAAVAELVHPAPADVPGPHILPDLAKLFIERIGSAGEGLPGPFQVWLAGLEKFMWF